MKKKIFLASSVSLGFILALAVNPVAAQDLKLKKFSIDPMPFAKGQTLTFTIEVENPTAEKLYGLAGIYFSVKESPGSTEKLLGQTPCPEIGPNQTVTITIAQKYTVPGTAGDSIVFRVQLPGNRPNVEFGPSTSYTCISSCTYKLMVMDKKKPGR